MAHQLSILNDIAQALNRSVDLDQSLRTALAKVAELLGLSTGWVFLLDEATGEPYLAAAQNLPPGLAESPRRMTGWCYCLETYVAGDLDGAANVNVVTCSRLRGLVNDGQAGGTAGLRCHASIPLQTQGERLGILNVASADWRQLSPEDLRLLSTIGDLVSIAVERARLFARSVQFGAAEERNRLAREIHDTLAQGLAAVSLQLEAADALLDAGAGAEQVQGAVREALRLTRASLEEARRSVLDLRAAPLEGRRLAAALAALVAEWRAAGADSEGAHRPDVRLEIDGARPLPTRVEVALYRVAQEALANIAQHAAARHASLHLETTPDRARLRIEDDGGGFEPARVPANRFGLVGMNERVRLLGGTLRLDTGPGAGTRIEVEVPLDRFGLGSPA
jgi:two-component system NarL family sensor kinase